MVNRNKLWQILALKGFPQHLIETNNTIVNGGRRSQKKILINQGVRQGFPLSLVLFNLHLDHP
jgi:hypothetical protein